MMSPETTSRLPALFLGHGSPMTMISNAPERQTMTVLGQRLMRRYARPRAILCITAHWQTRHAAHLTTGPAPRTIHDFSGFPPELYAVTYPAPGADWLVARVAELAAGSPIRGDDGWGFDHGVYGVVLPLLEASDIPTVAMSLNRSLSPEQHWALGQRLAPWRDEGVLIIASGNIVHNLGLYRQSMGTVPVWARDFQDRINAALLAGDTQALTNFEPGDEAARNAISSAEHYLPLLYAAGARLASDGIGIFSDTIDGALSMTSVLVGDAELIEGIA